MPSLESGIALTLNQQVTIPLPTDSTLIDSVLLYNYSPYLCEISSGAAPLGFLGAWSVDKWDASQVTTLNVNPKLTVGQNPSSPVFVATLAAAFILKGEPTHPGSFPCTLLGRVGPVVATELDIFDSNGVLIGRWSPDGGLQVISDIVTNSEILILPRGIANYPTIYMFTGQGANNPAYMSVIADGVGNAELGIHAGPFVNTPGRVVRDRLFMQDDRIQLGPIVDATQNYDGGELNILQQAAYLEHYTDGALNTSFNVHNNGVDSSRYITIQSEGWRNLALLNGWAADPAAGTQFGGLRIKYLADGTARIEGRLKAPAGPVNLQVIAALPTGLNFNTVPDHTIQIECLCTGPAGGITSVYAQNHTDGAAIALGTFPAIVGANGILVIQTVIDVSSGTTS